MDPDQIPNPASPGLEAANQESEEVSPRPAATAGADWATGPARIERIPRRRFRARQALGLGLAGILCFVAGMTGERLAAPPGLPSEINGFNLALFAQTLSVLDNHYVDAANLDQGKLQAAALDALVQAVGDSGHTSYLTAAQAAALDASLSGSFSGIGIEIGSQDGYPLIERVFPGSPAQAVGLLPGEEILSADGFDLHDATLEVITSHIRGPDGTTVRLVIKSVNGETRTLDCSRAKIAVPAVDWAMVADTDVADLRIEEFVTGEGDALISALKEIEAAGARAIVLDLRDNPGGYVSEVMTTASQFLSGGQVYLSQDASGKTTNHPVIPGGLDPTIPLAVLVDNGTASGAEIVAGALQDAARAKIVGATTFGTGTVLGRFPLSDGSVVEVGVERWLTPAGQAIWHVGIKPDIPIDAGSGSLLTPAQLRPGVGADWHADPVLAGALTLLTSQPGSGPTASPGPVSSPSPTG